MSGLAERNANGRRAEHRTEAFLLDHFWVLKLSLELDGAVFLAHAPTRTLESLRQPTTVRPVAVIQSKSWEDGAEVEVARLFVERSDRQPQKEFFVSIRAVDHSGKNTDFFFSAEEVQSIFRRRTNTVGQEVFVFSITNERNFSQFQRRDREKESMISKALAGVDLEKNQAYLKQVFEMPGSGAVQALLIQVAENQWQMRSHDVLFEFERDENSIIHGWKCDSAGKKQIAPLLSDHPLDDFEFDPLNEEWIPRPQ